MCIRDRPVSKNKRNRIFQGYWKICISLNAISGASSPYNANNNSKKVNPNHAVATTVSNLAKASKCSGLIKSFHPHPHLIRAIIVTTAETPECTAPITKYGAKIVECHPSTAVVTAKSQETIE